MALTRPCVACGRPGTTTGRCAEHQPRRATSNSKRGRYDATWRRVRLIVLDRDAHTCQECGARADTVDHIVPLARGGERLVLDNLRALCRSCNSRKGAR